MQKLKTFKTSKEDVKKMNEIAENDRKAYRKACSVIVAGIDEELETLYQGEKDAVGSKLTANLKGQNLLLRLKNKISA